MWDRSPMISFLFVAIFSHPALASTFTSGSLSKTFASPIFNENVGTQYPNTDYDTSIIAPLVVFESFKDLCDSDQDLTNLIVAIPATYTPIRVREKSLHAHCAQDRGALAVMLGFASVVPGGFFFVDQVDKAFPLDIPVLDILDSDLSEMTQEAEIANVTVHVVITENPWRVLYRSTVFTAFFRVIIPILSAFAILAVLESAFLHANLRFGSTKFARSNEHRAKVTMLASLVSELLACLVVFVQCAAGPIYSSGALPYEIHLIFPMLPGAFSVSSSLFTVILILTWASLADLKKQRALIVLSVIVAILAPSAIVGLNSALGFGGSINENTLVFIVGAVGVIATVYTFIVFTAVASRFLRRLSHLQNKLDISPELREKRTQSRKKFGMWLSLGITAKILMLAVTLFAAIVPSSTRIPWGYFSILLVLYFAVILQSLSQALGLRPKRNQIDIAKQRKKERQTQRNMKPKMETQRAKNVGERDEDSDVTPSAQSTVVEEIVISLVSTTTTQQPKMVRKPSADTVFTAPEITPQGQRKDRANDNNVVVGVVLYGLSTSPTFARKDTQL